MIVVQLTGRPSSGKTTIAMHTAKRLVSEGIDAEVLDGDVLRNSPINSGLGFSENDRKLNLERLYYIAELLVQHEIVVIIAAINPFESLRKKFAMDKPHVKTVWIKCNWQVLLERDTKGLYKRALLSEDHKDKLHEFTGVGSPYEEPEQPDLIIETDQLSIEQSVERLYTFILRNIKSG